MERALALLRTSTNHQDTQHQRDAVLAWAARQEPPARVDVREEPATSGAARSRPVLDALLEDARARRYDTLVVAALDRLGRDVVRIVTALDELRQAGVRVVSLREGIDFAGPMGRAMGALLGAIAEIERAAIRERVRSGLRTARSRGTKLGRPRLEWQEEDVDEVRRLIAEGTSIRRIAREGLVRVLVRDGCAVVPSEASIRNVLRRAVG